MYKIVICDDEQEFREAVMKSIVNLNMVTNHMEFYQFQSGEELLNSDLDFDLLFLDIQMPGKDGNEVSIMFRGRNKTCMLIFCTNYQMPQTENFKVYPFRYIMKDLHNKELSEELPDILNEMMSKTKRNYLTVVRDGEVIRVPIDTIMYLTVENRKMKIVCSDSKASSSIYCWKKLKEMYAELKQNCFEYAHSSYLVNMRKIIRVEGKTITMENGDQVYISRTKSKRFDDAFKKLLNRKFRR